MRHITSGVLVGRATELAELVDVLDAGAAGRPGCVLIGGEAGVGKTTLLGALTAHAAETGVRVLRCACVDLHGTDAPLLPVVEGLRRLAGDVGAAAWDEAVAEARPQLARVMPELGDAAGDEREATALLGALLGLVGRLAAQDPLLLAVDDVHWADPSTLDLLAFLARNLAGEPVVIAATFRDDEPDRPAWRRWLAEVTRLSVTTRLDVRRLSRGDLATLVGAITGASPSQALVDSIYARSAGNPFAAEELVAAGVDGGLPRTLADLLTERLAALSDDARRLVRVAAAIGDRVEHQLLETVVALDADALTAGVRDAAEHRLLAPTREGDRYAFRHPLIAEAAYAELLPGERARVHAAIAGTLAADPGLRAGNSATVAAEIAHHWDRAGDASRALAASVHAAQEAARACASAEALELFERSLCLWDEAPEPETVAGLSRLDLLEAAADAAVLRGAYVRGAELLDAALTLCAGDRSERTRTLHRRRAWSLSSVGEMSAALLAFEAAAVLLPDKSASAERAGILAESALLAGVVGELDAAESAALRALEMARATGARRAEGEALAALGVALLARGALAEAIAVMREALAISLETGRADDVGRAHANLSDALKRDGSLEEAAAVALDGAEQARRGGYDLGYGLFVAGNAAEAMLLLGRWEEADRLTARALESAPEGDTAEYLIRLRLLLEVGRGRLPEAEALARQTTPGAGRGSSPQFACLDAQARIALALAEGDLDAARAAWSDLDPADVAGAYDTWADVAPLALQAEAARAERGRARRRPEEAEDAAVAAALVWALSGDAPSGHPGRQSQAAWLTARAEQTRVDGGAAAGAWADAQAAWDAIGAAPAGAYARFRRAEALLGSGGARDEAEVLLRDARATSVRVGAAPLRADVEQLARRARLDLTGTAAPVPEEEAAFGLTRRELEVLEHLVDGETNRQIADALFISVKTAGTHVTSILRKLDAHTRGEAAAAAVRGELVRRPATPPAA